MCVMSETAATVLVSGAPWYTGDLEDEGGFSAEFTEWWTQQTANEGTHIAQAYAELGDRFLFHRDPGPAVSHSVLEQALMPKVTTLRRTI